MITSSNGLKQTEDSLFLLSPIILNQASECILQAPLAWNVELPSTVNIFSRRHQLFHLKDAIAQTKSQDILISHKAHQID